MNGDSRAQFDEGFYRRRDHANIEAMQNLIIDAVTNETTHPMPPLVRNFLSALQSSHGGGKVANEPFTRSHVRVASYMQFKGDRATKEQRVRRLINRLEEHKRKTGYQFFLIKRGGEPVGVDERGNTIYSATEYTDFLKPVADAAVQRARASELWKRNPGDALAAQVGWAVEQLPRVDERPEEKGEGSMLPLAEYEKQSEDQIRAAVEKRAEGIAQRGGDVNVWLERLEVQISRLRRSRAKMAEAERGERMRARMEAREAEGRAFDAEMWGETDGGHPPTKVTPPPAVNPSVSEDTSGTLAAALDYAARGIPVFPVRQNKAPYTPRGFKDATCDEAAIREWWRKWPDAGIGIPTGVASGWLVLDIDPRHGGDVSLDRLKSEHGALPQTVESLTGGGGRHLLFRHPGGTIKSTTGALAPGVDVKADGGYIVAPPSLHDETGRRYEWEVSRQPDETPPADLPPAWRHASFSRAESGQDALRSPYDGTGAKVRMYFFA